MPVERLVHGFLIGEVDLCTHRPSDPAKRPWTGLIRFALVQSLGEEIRDEAAQRFAFLLLASFEIPQNRCVNIDRRSWHDALMINVFASDVKSRVSTNTPFWSLQLVLLATLVRS
jgi:hypothetical protein